MNTLINIIIIGGLFVLAYFVARLLSDVFPVPYTDPEEDPNYLPADPFAGEKIYLPTSDEWDEWTRVLDDEAQDGDDHR